MKGRVPAHTQPIDGGVRHWFKGEPRAHERMSMQWLVVYEFLEERGPFLLTVDEDGAGYYLDNDVGRCVAWNPAWCWFPVGLP